jgi:hypothetical protein
MQLFSNPGRPLPFLPLAGTAAPLSAGQRPLTRQCSKQYIIVLKSDSQPAKPALTLTPPVSLLTPGSGPIAAMHQELDCILQQTAPMAVANLTTFSYTIHARQDGSDVWTAAASASLSGFSSGSVSTNFTVIR